MKLQLTIRVINKITTASTDQSFSKRSREKWMIAHVCWSRLVFEDYTWQGWEHHQTVADGAIVQCQITRCINQPSGHKTSFSAWTHAVSRAESVCTLWICRYQFRNKNEWSSVSAQQGTLPSAVTSLWRQSRRRRSLNVTKRRWCFGWGLE